MTLCFGWNFWKTCLVILSASGVFEFAFSLPGWGRGICRLPSLANGRVRTRGRARLAKFHCLPGFELVGNKYATCRDDRWDVPIPVCVRPGCSRLSGPVNGNYLTGHRGSWAIFFCDPDFRLTGSSVLFCNGRAWNDTEPTCIDSSAPPSSSCDFETGLCDWLNDEMHDFDWRRYSGKTPSAFLNTGPPSDHTLGATGKGHYMYVESTSQKINDTARLLSPIYKSDLTRNGCFSFYYHMFGRTTGTLRVYVKPESMNLQILLSMDSEERKKYVFFEKSGDQGNIWLRGVFKLNESTENFQIIMEGVRGTSYTSDIAIDDVSILQGTDCTIALETLNPPAVLNITKDSCVNRCNRNVIFTAAWELVECTCTEDCLDDNTCCEDYRDICYLPDAISTTLSEDSYESITPRDEMPALAPQTMKLVASTIQNDYSQATRASTKPSTKLTTLSTVITTKTTTIRTTIPLTTRKTRKPISTTSPSTIKDSVPKIIFATTTPPPYNATGKLQKDAANKTINATTVVVNKNANVTVVATNKTGNVVLPKSIKNNVTKVVTKIANATTVDVKVTIKTTTSTLAPLRKVTGNPPVSRTFENHNNYHELVKKYHKSKEEAKEKQDSDPKEPEGGGVVGPVLGTLAGLALLALLLGAALRSPRLKDSLMRLRLRRTSSGEEVRYLTQEEEIDFK